MVKFSVSWLAALAAGSVSLNAETRFDEDATQPFTGWTIRKWAHGLGHFSKFIRPSDRRVEVAPSEPAEGLFVSAYKGEDGRLTVVAINQSETPQELDLDLGARSAFAYRLYQTSSKLDSKSVSKENQPMTQKPQILLILSDQHNAATCGCYGDTLGTTPHLDALAQRGITFDNCY